MNRWIKVGMVALLGGIAAEAAKPNIVVILADDYGYGSANCYGASAEHIRTPHINQLAAEGMRFTDANTPASVCSPTRYAFLTGRYAWRGVMKHGVLTPLEGPLAVEPELLTLPAYLKERGYRSAHIGKWHLGYTTLPNTPDLSAQPLEPGPRSMGFDYHFGLPNNLDWLPKVYVENEGIWGLRSKGKTPYGKSFYKGRPYHGYDAPQRVTEQVTRVLSNKAGEWIAKTVAEDPDRPFFLYFAPVAVHHPIAPSDEFRGSSGVGPYGDFIHDLDDSVGDVVAALKSAGVLDDTLLIFTSDNGGDFCPEEREARELGFKNNGEIRGDKHLIWQGGFKVPFIARWPDHIAAGSETDRMVNLVDLHATIQELVSGEVLAAENAAPDSFSFHDELVGGTGREPRETMVQNDVRGIKAIRAGDWKFINADPLRPQDQARAEKNPNAFKPELYNLKADPAEENNLILAHPEVAERMERALRGIQSIGSERIAAKRNEKANP